MSNHHCPPSQPIGLFDSGVGGLSVYLQVRQLLPQEDMIYIADSAYIPYGNKSRELVSQRAMIITQHLIDMGAKAIVVACNTATAAAVALLRERFKVPIIGMEPGLKPGVAASMTGKVAILATEGTLGSGKFQSLVERHANGTQILVQPCHGWVELVETQSKASQEGRQLIADAINPLLAQGVDTLVLGCTHYPFLKDIILETLNGRQVHLIDTGHAVARHLKKQLAELNLLNTAEHAGRDIFLSGIAGTATDALFSDILQRPCQVEPLAI